MGFSQPNATRRALLPAPGPHRWGCIVVVLLLLYFAHRGWMRSLRPAGSDFTIYYRAAQHALRGLDPMQGGRFLYLPSFAVLIAPLALLPLPLASGLWHAASLVAILWAVASMAEQDCASPVPWLAWLPLLGLLRLFDSNLSNGRVNAFTRAMLVASLCALRRGRETATGLWVGLATATKVLPAFALLYFLLRGRRRTLLSGGLASLLLILVLPVAVLGWSAARRSLAAWPDAVASTWSSSSCFFSDAGRGYLLRTASWRWASCSRYRSSPPRQRSSPGRAGAASPSSSPSLDSPHPRSWAVGSPLACSPSARSSPVSRRCLFALVWKLFMEGRQEAGSGAA